MLLKSAVCLLALIQCFYFVRSSVTRRDGYHNAIGIKKFNTLLAMERGSRIVGGTQVPRVDSHPHQAGIVVTLTNGRQSVCGGAVVSNTRVLTAAHCWWDGQNQAKQFLVVLGSLLLFSGGTRITTTDVTVHPNWNTKDIINDIAIVKISTVNFNNNIKAIPLPALSDANQNFAGLTATATGYGKTSDAQTSFPTTTSLHQINLNIVTNVECQKSFEPTLHGSHLCTQGSRGVGTCDGDSGGPLTVMWNNKRTLVGIVSFGLGDGCQAGFPSVYTRVTAFLSWINANL